MRQVIFTVAFIALAAVPVHAQHVVLHFGPTTEFSTLNCADFAKRPDGSWKALHPQKFGLGVVTGIVPPIQPIASGVYIDNNIDL